MWANPEHKNEILVQRGSGGGGGSYSEPWEEIKLRADGVSPAEPCGPKQCLSHSRPTFGTKGNYTVNVGIMQHSNVSRSG